MSRDKKAMEEYLLARGIGFPSCPKCPERKEGCHKNCKFIKAYKKEKQNEQRFTKEEAEKALAERSENGKS